MQDKDNISEKSERNLEELRKTNLTNSSFYIHKAEVELITEDGRESFLASIKYTKPDSFLISLRSKTGIEAARIFISNDTMLINDRINRKLYFGSAKDLKKKFGFSSKLLPVLFGDIILKNENLTEIENCKEGVYKLYSAYEGLRLNYVIDCKYHRLVKVNLTSELDTKPIIIEFSEAKNRNEIYMYSKVHISDFKGYKYINIDYRNIETPYNGFINFVPGKNYERVRIR